MRLLVRGFVSLSFVKFACSIKYFHKETRRLRRVSNVHFETPVTREREPYSTKDGDIDERSELIQNQNTARHLSIWSSFMNMLHPHHNSRQNNQGGNNESSGTSPSQSGESDQSPTPSMQSLTPSSLSPTLSDDNVSNDTCWWCPRSERSRSYTSEYVRQFTFGIFAIGSTALGLSIIIKRRRNGATTREHLLEGSVQRRRTLFAKVFYPGESTEGQASHV